MFPATVLAAAVMLSITSAADVTVAAVLMNAGRQVPTRAMADAESLGQWLSRFADAARQIRDVFGGDEAGPTFAGQPAGLSNSLDLHLGALVAICESEQFTFHFIEPLRAALTDLPPPVL